MAISFDFDGINVRNILNDPSYDLNRLDGNGKTILHAAVEEGSLELVTIIAYHERVNGNIPNSQGDTPLHLAAAFDKRKITEVLLQAPSMEPNTENKMGKTAFKIAYNSRCCRSLKALVSCVDVDVDLTIEDLLTMESDVFEIIKTRACDLDATDRDGNTFLHLLVPKAGTLPKMKILLENGFPVDSLNKRGETALHLACKKGIQDGSVSYEPLLSELPTIGCNLDKIKLLLKYSDNLEIQDKNGLTPLAVAIRNNNLDCAAKTLALEGANTDGIEMPSHILEELSQNN